MARKKLTVDLGNLNLTDAQHKKLLNDIHTAVKTNLNKIKGPAPQKKIPAGKKMALAADPAPQGVTATISATFTNTEPGLSELNLIFNGKTQKLTQSGKLQVPGVVKGSVILIQGKSLGNAEISIDVNAKPQSMKFLPGTFNFNFRILGNS